MMEVSKMKKRLCTFKFHSGDLFSGNFKDGLKHGKGTYIWSNGRKFDGSWEKDIKTWERNFYFQKWKNMVREKW